MTVNWFEAEFTSGECSACSEPIKRGDLIAYGTGTPLDTGLLNAVRTMVGQKCCGDNTDLVAVESKYIDSRDLTGRHPVMPHNRTARDVCIKCFLIHTIAQGKECY
jgi:hypothetical protein